MKAVTVIFLYKILSMHLAWHEVVGRFESTGPCFNHIVGQ